MGKGLGWARGLTGTGGGGMRVGVLPDGAGESGFLVGGAEGGGGGMQS